MLDELKHLGPWIMIVSLRRSGVNILILKILRSPSDMGSKPRTPKKNPSHDRFRFCNLVDFVINKTWSAKNFFVFTPPPPRPPPTVSPSLVSQLLKFFYNCNENLILTIKSKVILVTCSCQCWFLPTEVDYLGQLLNHSGDAQKHHLDQCTWTSRRRKMYVQKLVIESIQ